MDLYALLQNSTDCPVMITFLYRSKSLRYAHVNKRKRKSVKHFFSFLARSFQKAECYSYL